MPQERHRIIPAAYVILRRGNEILMQRRLNTGYEDGNYGLVSGHVEKESYVAGIIREAKEEVGIDLKPEYLSMVHLMHRRGESDENIIGDVFFVAEKWDGKIKNMEPAKCDDLSWFSMDNLPENTIPYIREALKYVDESVLYSEYDW